MNNTRHHRQIKSLDQWEVKDHWVKKASKPDVETKSISFIGQGEPHDTIGNHMIPLIFGESTWSLEAKWRYMNNTRHHRQIKSLDQWEVKDHWVTKASKPDVETTGVEKPLGKQQTEENKDVETTGVEKPLGKQKTHKNMWRPMGVKNHWAFTKNEECGDQWGSKTIGKSKKQKKQNV